MDLDGFDGLLFSGPTFNIPDFFRRKIALYLRTVRGAWGAFRDRHGDPQKVAQSNRPEEWAPYALTKLRRLEKILLRALALAASFVETLAAPKARPPRARTPRVVNRNCMATPPPGDCRSRGCRMWACDTSATWRANRRRANAM